MTRQQDARQDEQAIVQPFSKDTVRGARRNDNGVMVLIPRGQEVVKTRQNLMRRRAHTGCMRFFFGTVNVNATETTWSRRVRAYPNRNALDFGDWTFGKCEGMSMNATPDVLTIGRFLTELSSPSLTSLANLSLSLSVL